MDVQTVTSSAPPAAPSVPAAPSTDLDGSAQAPATSVQTSPPAGVSAPAPPVQAAASPAPDAGSQSSTSGAAPVLPGNVRDHSSTLSAVTKTLVGATVSVSYDTISEPNHVITVFKDARTGQTLFKVPPEVLVQLAQFFDQVSGAVVDRKA